RFNAKAQGRQGAEFYLVFSAALLLCDSALIFFRVVNELCSTQRCKRFNSRAQSFIGFLCGSASLRLCVRKEW
ncbi:MAG: hypothetical protein U9R05_06590, partial [Chloroflexota bacterium]|nr:hypothetical protein [Chloroflexota bacterium]